jgi:hypothetical protein
MSTDEYQLSAPAGKQTPRRNETQSYFFHHPSPFEGTLPFSLGMKKPWEKAEKKAWLHHLEGQAVILCIHFSPPVTNG